jgi:hypothetical protein
MSNAAAFIINKPEDFKKLTGSIKQAVTKAGINTVNIQAALARKTLVSTIPTVMNDRYGFVAKQAQFTQMPNKAVKTLSEIQATIGFARKADFMPRQEEGGTHQALGGSLRIYTDVAREGRAKPGKVQTRLGYKKNMRKMIIPLITKGKNHKQRQIIRTAAAAKSGMLMWGSGRGSHALFRVTGFKNRAGGGFTAKSEMMINLRHKRTRTPAKRFFINTVEKSAGDVQKIFNSQMDKLARGDG